MSTDLLGHEDWNVQASPNDIEITTNIGSVLKDKGLAISDVDY